jgi:protein-tyrosine phosphatase
MNHVYWVTPTLAGRCGPVQCGWDLDQLYQAGIRVIVSLDDNVNPQEIEKRGFTHFQLYLPDIPLSTPALTETFLRAANKFIDFMVSNKEPVLVHCWAGNDRTGAMLACFLISQGKPSEEAIAIVRKQNPYAMITPGYEEAVHLFAELVEF